MAIHPLYPGLTAGIRVHDQLLREYDDIDAQNTDAGVVTKYVEARSGDEFTANVHFAPPFPSDKHVKISSYVDGFQVESLIQGRDRLYRASGTEIRGVQERSGSGWVLRTFRFGDLPIAERDDDATQDLRMADEMGTFTVVLHFGDCIPRDKAGQFRGYALANEQISLSEKTLKGDSKSLMVTSGSSTTIEAKPLEYKFKAHSIDPFAMFRFKYRSKADLEMLGVVPRTASRSASPRTHYDVSPRRHSTAMKLFDGDATLDVRGLQTHQGSALKASTSAVRNEPGSDGLTREDLFSLTAHYRKTTAGLSSLSTEELRILFNSYRAKAAAGTVHTSSSDPSERTTVKQEALSSTGARVCIKREQENDDAKRPRVKRAKQIETIVLDK